MSLLNLWSLFKSTLFLHLSLMDKIIVLAPPTKRKHPAPPPVLQQTSPAHFPRNERLVLLSQSERKTPISYNLQQTSPANERLLLFFPKDSVFKPPSQRRIFKPQAVAHIKTGYTSSLYYAKPGQIPKYGANISG